MPICKYCGTPTEDESEICPHCAEARSSAAQMSVPAAPAQAVPDAAALPRPHRRPLYIIPIIILFAALLLIILLFFGNPPEKRAEDMLNSFAKGYLTGDTDAVLETMPQCELNDLMREWGADGYKEFVHTSLSYGKAEYLDANYGENISVRFEDVTCKEMSDAKKRSLERHLNALYHADTEIGQAYFVSCTVCVSGSERSEQLPIDHRVALIRIGSRWSLYGISPALLAPDNQV